MKTQTPAEITDIADVQLRVEHMRREGLCIFRTDDTRHWTLKEDAGPLATIGGAHTGGPEAFGGHIPDTYANLFTAAPAMLKALEGMVNEYVATYGDEGDDAPDTVKAAIAAAAQARRTRRSDQDAAAVSDDPTGI